MDPERSTSGEFGRIDRAAGDRWAFYRFIPNTMPRELTLEPAVVSALSEADAALGQLQGLCQLVREPELLVGPYLAREAVASSRIEGTQASLSDLLQAEAGARAAIAHDDVVEVERYLAASRFAFRRLSELPISRRLIVEIHSILLADVRGAEKLPGQLRKTPVWIGPAGATLESATFVPPLPDEVLVDVARK